MTTNHNMELVFEGVGDIMRNRDIALIKASKYETICPHEGLKRYKNSKMKKKRNEVRIITVLGVYRK